VRAREDALRDAARYRRVGRQATTVLVGLLVLMTVAAVAAIFVWFGTGLGDKFGFASGVFGLMSGLISYVVAKARGAGLPPWPLPQNEATSGKRVVIERDGELSSVDDEVLAGHLL
jgi:hypothetical protein